MKKAFLLALFLLLPWSAYAALININTANLATLETLPHIGQTLAQRIIDYRTQNGPFTSVQGLQKVSGIGSGSNYTDIAPLVTVGDAGGSDTPPTNTPPTNDATSTTPLASTTPKIVSTGGAAEYLPIPILRVVTGGDRVVATGADTAFTANVYDAKAKRDDAFVTWSFGDGMQKTGASVLHPFYAPGEYMVIVQVTTSDGGNTKAQLVVTVQDAGIRISSVSEKGIALTNPSGQTLDISWWKLRADKAEFKFPDHTLILGGHTVLFVPQVTELPSSSFVDLLLPSGEVVDTYPHTALPVVQPPAPVVSYKKVQTVEPVISQAPHNGTDAALAPAAPAQTAVAGALVATSSSKLMHIAASPWSFGFLGILVAGGAALLVL